jgi:hypothetical protein
VYRFDTKVLSHKMNTIKKLMYLFSKTTSKLSIGKAGTIPLLIIKKEADGANISEYRSIEEAISDLENDPNVPLDKIERLKLSLKQLKNKTSINIRNGEITK